MMAQSLKVMISSRCDSKIPFSEGEVSLTDLRRELKTLIESKSLFDEKPLFSVWINDEDAAAAAADEASWEHCLRQAEESEIFVCLYNGEAGWSATAGGIGICHAELERALCMGRLKVVLIEIPEPNEKCRGAEQTRNEHFQEFVHTQGLFRGSTVSTKAEAIRRIEQSIQEQVIRLTRRGKFASKRDSYDRGEALNWSRLSFAARKAAIETIMKDYFIANGATLTSSNHVIYEWQSKKLSFILSAIPGSLAVGAAKELVGRPQLNDHIFSEPLEVNDSIGPIHVIACHKGVTETQAISILGFPDAVVIKSGFGVYVADNIQKCQLVFLEGCRDSATTRQNVQLFFEWLTLSGEAQEMIDRACARTKIIAEIKRHA
ncbi:MAG: DUF4062 domain-containing protein [Pseudomonadota bacterium]|nr:DUF4062 domain-containing protein [Pseudomonadota bacterium]QKK05114.1 MAG: DUF4062 domain-containing protein [Pseudomonadota bacterium]